MNGLIKINNTSERNYLRGFHGRIQLIEGDTETALVAVEPALVAKLNVSTYRLKLSSLDLIADGEKVTTGQLLISSWSHLNNAEKASAVKTAIQANFNEYYENFEPYITQGAGPEFLDAFILEATFRRDTHDKYGSKAIFEELRFHTYLKDACHLFKVNNNFTGSMALLVTTLFPEITGFFQIKKNHLEEVA